MAVDLPSTGWFRSAKVQYVSVILQGHLAHDAVEALGDLSACQFHDLQPGLTPFQRRYTKYIRRCDELERIIRTFDKEMEQHHVTPLECSMDEFRQWKQTRDQVSPMESSRQSLLEYLESNLQARHKEYQEMSSYREELSRAYYHQVERMHVLTKAGEFFQYETRAGFVAELDGDATGAGAFAGGNGIDSPRSNPDVALLSDTDIDEAEHGIRTSSTLSGMRFQHITGVILKEEQTFFERMLFRASRGNSYVRFAEIEETLENDKGERVDKLVFIIFYRASSLTAKLRRICDAFTATRHSIPHFDNPEEVSRVKAELQTQINDSARVLEENKNLTYVALRNMSQYIDKWRKGVMREKAVYHTMNLFEPYTQGMLRGQAWVLSDAMPLVNEALANVHAGTLGGGSLPFYLEPVEGKWPTPPTYFHVNKFTLVFQKIVNTYGVPRYREANPGLFTAITFPFLFGVMYGDVGHASLLFFFAAYIVWNEKKLTKGNVGEIFGMCVKGRYMLLLMGIFGVYCGFVYNEFFAQSMNLFGSRWRFAEGSTVAERTGDIDDVYPFGADPQWHTADNQLLFFNSLKMKLSVILGVIQMTFGLCLKVSNAVHFGSTVDILFECIPQLIFMLGLFGYMLFLIIYKWGIDWRAPTAPGAPPNLIDTLISIVLAPGTIEDGMYSSQASVQLVLVALVFLSIPWMLLPKPFILRYQHRRAHPESHTPPPGRRGSGSAVPFLEFRDGESSDGDSSMHGVALTGVKDNPTAGNGLGGNGTAPGSGGAAVSAVAGGGSGGGGHGGGHGGHDDEEEFEFGEVFIHQAIETIEFVLGTISNTASYLRLWALSLAHSELATVFWEKAMVGPIKTKNVVMIIVGYAVFAGVTFGVLCVMDVLECFLHALRLHWVEFQNKFYRADGHAFEPFSFKASS